jgi:hypothetical protein
MTSSRIQSASLRINCSLVRLLRVFNHEVEQIAARAASKQALQLRLVI